MGTEGSEADRRCWARECFICHFRRARFQIRLRGGSVDGGRRLTGLQGLGQFVDFGVDVGLGFWHVPPRDFVSATLIFVAV